MHMLDQLTERVEYQQGKWVAIDVGWKKSLMVRYLAIPNKVEIFDGKQVIGIPMESAHNIVDFLLGAIDFQDGVLGERITEGNGE